MKTPLTEKLDCALATAPSPHSVTLNKLLAVECRNTAAERDRLRRALQDAVHWCEHNGCGTGNTAEMPWLEDAIAALKGQA